MSGQGGDDLDGLTGFFFYMFIVHPITAWILRPGRFERKKSIMYAIGFLAALAAVKTGASCMQFTERISNTAHLFHHGSDLFLISSFCFTFSSLIINGHNYDI